MPSALLNLVSLDGNMFYPSLLFNSKSLHNVFRPKQQNKGPMISSISINFSVILIVANSKDTAKPENSIVIVLKIDGSSKN